VTVGMFAFLAGWNEFLTPLIFLTDGSNFTLPVALVSLRSGELGTIDLGALQAGIVVTALPCLLMFLLLQRHYVRGFTAGSVRG
jgi:multiple sugar transport system permease protein